jgi:putative component of membrane protein insertase Oxa1/YidC/SpoIIIJ protein YidD
MLKRILAASFILLFVLSGFNVYSQSKSDIELVSNLFEVKSEKPDYKVFAKENPNELQLIASGLFLFYKSFFSSQDGNHCVFHPSCSVYTIESIKKHGIFIGIIDGMDRLQRCNRLSPEKYERYENTNLLSDPVE